MSGTSSASPQNLDTFVTDAGAATALLEQASNGAAVAVADFYDAPCDPRFRPAGDRAAFGHAQRLVADNQTDERWIAGIRQAFIQADTTVLPDATIAANLQAASISATAPGQITADEPVYQGATMYSGWSDDPVSTGAGHFLEVEEDLVMPASLRVLRWTRTYSSRFVRAGAGGPGWHCWADTRLEIDDTQVVYHGPDGQVAPFARTASAGLVRHPGMEASLVEVEGGFELRWRWNARFPGMTWCYDWDGRLLRLRDPFGGDVVAEHADGRLVALAHQGGRRLTIAWEEDTPEEGPRDGARIAEVVSSDGRRIRYRYDGDHLVEVDRPAGTVRYVMGTDRRIAEVVDADGVRMVHNEYDADGRVVAQESPFGRVSRYRYIVPSTLVVGDDDGGPSTLFRHDAAGRLVEMQLADGSRSSRRFDERGNPVEVVGFDGVVTQREFDIDGNCVWEARLGGPERRWAYDHLGRLVRSIDEVGTELVLHYDGDGPVPVRLSGPLGFERTFELRHGLVVAASDSDGVTTRYDRDDDGQVVAVTDGEGGTTHLRYHPSGAPIERVAPTGEAERWEVDGAGRPIAYVAPGGARTERILSDAGRVCAVADGTGAVCRFEWGDHGQASAMIDPLGETSTFTWDDLGHRVGADLPDGAEWHFAYDPVGRLSGFLDPVGERWNITWASNGAPAALLDPLGRGVEVDYEPDGSGVAAHSAAGRQLDIQLDPAGRMVGGTVDDGGSSCAVQRDALGRIVGLSIDDRDVGRWTYTPGGRLDTVSRPDGTLWRWIYDRAGRAVAIEGPEGRQGITYDAAGRTVRVVSSDRVSGQRAVDLAWDPDGRLAAASADGTTNRYAWDPAGRLVEAQVGDEPAQRFRYDPRGSLVEAADSLGATTTFEYNRRGALIAAVDPSGGRWACERDANDRVVATIDPLGRRTAQTLDPSGRLVAMTMPDGTEYGYDRNPDGMLDGIRIGDRRVLSTERDLTARETTLRDDRGHLTRLGVDGLDRIVTYQRDDSLTGWAYDDEGRRVTVTSTGLPSMVVHVDARGLAVGLDVEGLAPVEVTRDGEGRVTRVRCGVLERRWERDPAGWPVAYEETIDGRSHHRTTIERDRDRRVVAETTDGVSRRYRYDVAGQLTGMEGPDGEWAWAYDASGRMVTEEGPEGLRRLTYDDADQLRHVDGPDGPADFAYDARGRRVRRDDSAGVTTYRWDVFDRLSAVNDMEIDTDAIGALSGIGGRPAGGLPGAQPGELLVRAGAGGIVEIAGAPIAETSPAGTAAVSADWRHTVGSRSVWGEDRDDSGPEVGVGWLGELELDGLVWLRHRVYDPATHSFLSKDPLAGLPGWPGSLTNPYGYAHNDPLRWLDPLGLSPMTADAASAQMHSWHQGHWKEALITGLAVVGTAALVVATGGAAAVVVPMLIGAAAGGVGTAANALIFNHGHIDWGEVIMNTATGALLGAASGPLAGQVAGALPGAAGDLTATTAMDQLPQAARIALNTGVGGTFGASQTAADSWATDRPITLQSEAIGFAGGALPGAIPTKTWGDVMNPEAKAAMEGWMSRHPNAVHLPRGSTARLAAAKDAVGGINSWRVQPPTLVSGGTAIALTPPPPDQNAAPSAPVACPPRPAGFIGPLACR